MNYFERFLSYSERSIVTHDLAALGARAIPILEEYFDFSAKNSFGIPYRKAGPLDCAYVTIKLLGPIAKPLEKYVREGIELNHPYAIEAARYMLQIEEETALSLAKALVRQPASEAGTSLVYCGYSENPKVIEIVTSNPLALKTLKEMEVYISKNT
jgi:hypothetical protein